MHCMSVCLGVLLMTCFHVTDDLTVRIIFIPFFPLLKKCKCGKLQRVAYPMCLPFTMSKCSRLTSLLFLKRNH